MLHSEMNDNYGDLNFYSAVNLNWDLAGKTGFSVLGLSQGTSYQIIRRKSLARCEFYYHSEIGSPLKTSDWEMRFVERKSKSTGTMCVKPMCGG